MGVSHPVCIIRHNAGAIKHLITSVSPDNNGAPLADEVSRRCLATLGELPKMSFLAISFSHTVPFPSHSVVKAVLVIIWWFHVDSSNNFDANYTLIGSFCANDLQLHDNLFDKLVNCSATWNGIIDYAESAKGTSLIWPSRISLNNISIFEAMCSMTVTVLSNKKTTQNVCIVQVGK